MTRILLLVLPTLLLMSCGNREKIIDNTTEPIPSSVATEVTFVGVVVLDPTCGPVIQVETENDSRSFALSNFDERYKKEGMRIRFGTVDNLETAKKCGDHLIVLATRMTPLR